MARKKRAPTTPGSISIGSEVKLRAMPGRYRTAEDGTVTWYWVARWTDTEGRKSKVIGWHVAKEAERLTAAMVADGTIQITTDRHVVIDDVEDLLSEWGGKAVDPAVAAGALRPQSAELYTYAAKRLTALIGDVKVRALSDAFVQDQARAWVIAGNSPKYVETWIKVLRMAHKWARERGHINLPPLRPRFRAAPKTERVQPEADQLERLWVGFVQAQPPIPLWARAYARMIADTGARPGDLSSLLRSQVDERRDQAHVPATSKTGARVVDLTPETMQALRAAGLLERHPDAYLWPVTPAAAEDAISQTYLPRACAAAGLPRMTALSLRHAFIREGLRAGVDVRTLAKIVGNSPTTLLKNYGASTEADRKEGVLAIRALRRRTVRKTEKKVIAFPGTEEP